MTDPASDDDARKRAEVKALRYGLSLVRRRATETLAVDSPPDLKIVPKESPVDRVRAIQDTHPPPAEWVRELHEIAPPSLKVAWLAFGWLEKAERWVIYQCIPQPLIPTGKREQLEGTPYWKMPVGRRVGRQQAVSAYQWEMYRKHQVWARPFWCLQGTAGGTPARYSEMEEALLQATGQPTDPPEPGAFCYAPFDGRAVRQLRARDRLWQMGGSLERLYATADAKALKAETAEAERAFRKAFYGWWEDLKRDDAEFLAWFTASETRMAGAPAELFTSATPGELRAGSELKDQYIETGLVPVATRD